MILVTGGAGFIGSNLVKRLNAYGTSDIIISDMLGRDDKYENLVGLKYRDYIFAGNLLDSNIFNDIETIYHLGACSSTTETDVDYLISNNFEYTKRLCNIALDNHIHFVYASSAATYGNGDRGMSDRVSDVSIYKPMNAYGYSKQLFDLYAQGAGLLTDITGLKYFNIFGPGEEHKGDMRSLVSKAVKEIQTTGKLRLFKSNDPDIKDGEQSRDFLYVTDAVDITLDLQENDLTGIYNVGSGVSNTWNYLAECIFGSMDMDFNVEYIEMPKSLSVKYQNHTQADISKLKSMLHDVKIMDLSDAVDVYIQNYLLK